MPEIMLEASSNPWFLYLIRTHKGSLYTGITTDVDRRFLEHQLGGLKGAKFLKGKGPLTLEFSTIVKNRSVALKLEYKVKQLTKVNKERIIVDSGFLRARFPELMSLE